MSGQSTSTCTHCGTVNFAGRDHCRLCRTILIDESEQHGAPSAIPQAQAVAAAVKLTLVLPGGDRYAMARGEVTVGRAEPVEHWLPDLDLAAYGGDAPQFGISRRHARLVRKDGAFVVLDAGSMNGTYINGRRVPYNHPIALSDGDVLTFGSLDTRVLLA